MKKKLNELNRKIRHSKKKHDGMIYKRNALKKAIEGIKHGTKPASEKSVPNWRSIERDFNGSYRRYRVNGRPRIDANTFLSWIRES